FFQARAFCHATRGLSSRVERFLAGKVIVDKRLRNARGSGQLTGRRIGDPLRGKKRQGRRYDGLSPLLRAQSLIKHVSKLVNTHHLSTLVLHSSLSKSTRSS